jgi:hypothetical protein
MSTGIRRNLSQDRVTLQIIFVVLPASIRTVGVVRKKSLQLIFPLLDYLSKPSHHKKASSQQHYVLLLSQHLQHAEPSEDFPCLDFCRLGEYPSTSRRFPLVYQLSHRLRSNYRCEQTRGRLLFLECDRW